MSDSMSTLKSQQAHAPTPVIGLREVMDAVPDLLFCCDGFGRFAWVSPAFETLTGHRASDLIGQPISRLVPAEERCNLVRHFMKQRRLGSGFTTRRVWLSRVDGSRVRVEARVRAWTRPDGEFFWAGVAYEPTANEFTLERDATRALTPSAHALDAALTHDVARLETRVRELESDLVIARRSASNPGADDSQLAQLRRERDQALRQANLKSELLATLSHEIRTPMNGMIGMAHLLLDSQLQVEQRRRVEVIHESSRALLALLNDALDYSRLEAGRLQLETIGFDLRVTFEQVTSLLAPLAHQKGLHYDVRIDPTVPSRLLGDPGRLRQVLMNLASNAIKFTNQGGTVELHVARENESNERVTLLFRVADSGIGLSPEQQERLFEPFVQAEASITRRFGGSGLGLAISRQLIERMGGEVGLRSAPGEGSTFWFRLPLAKQVDKPAPGALDARAQLRGCHVLIADAAPSVRESVGELLAGWGCVPHVAETGVEALRAIRSAAAAGQPIQVAIVDQQLEGMDGHDLAMAVRADHDLDATRLMLITHFGRPGDAQTAHELGFSAYLLKPFEWAQLYDALIEITSTEHVAAEPAARPLVTRHSIAEARRTRTRILLVEDDTVNQLVTTSALTRVGYQVEVAGNGRQALERTESEHWDLILMDVQMPDIDGCRAAAAIRARERGGHRVPILALTGDAQWPGERERCLQAGMDDVLGKPVDLALLTTQVERWAISGETRSLDAGRTIGAPVRAPEPSPRAEALPEVALVALPELPEGPPLDLEQLDTTCMGLPVLRQSMLSAFHGEIGPRMQRLEIALLAGDARRVEFEAHGLRGMCATIGAVACTRLLSEIERHAREQRLPAVRALIEPMTEQGRRAQAFVEGLEGVLIPKAA